MTQVSTNTLAETIVARLVYDGETEIEIALALGLKKAQVRKELQSIKGQKLLEVALDKKLELVARLPMANFATRMNRLEKIYQQGFGTEDVGNDSDLQLKCLSMAREEMRVAKTEQATLAPQIQVNVLNYETPHGNGKANSSMAIEPRIELITSVKESPEGFKTSQGSPVRQDRSKVEESGSGQGKT
jgi:hypothetical protein